ncbi:MAG: FAD-binding protein [Anaerolineae bacterium]|nr:FAD-binding protein [Anaerolineae bacterium]
MNLLSSLPDFFNDLQKRISGDLRTDRYSRILYSTDASSYQVMPYGVLIPKTAEDIQAALELAAQYKIPVLPRAAGTSLAGQAVNEALVVDVSRYLDRVLEINREEHWGRVQPGVVLDELNSQLNPLGLHFGPDPASSNRAAMGGIVGNNASGSHSILYGMTADHVLEMNVILSDGSPAHFGPLEAAALSQYQQRTGLEGEIYRGITQLTQTQADIIRAGTPHHWRRCGGYNLDRLIEGPSFLLPPDPRFNLAALVCGSEGTLATMTEIKLNLVPRPRLTALALVQFDNLYEALTATPVILQTEPSAVELLDNLGLTMCREVPEYARLLATFIQGQPYCILITEFYGESEAELKAKVDRLTRHLQKEKVNGTVVPLLNPALQNNVWAVRKAGLGLLMSVKGDYKPTPFIEDAAVPVEHLAEYVTRVEQFCLDLGTKVSYYAHASAGCLHIRPLINAKLAGEVDKLPRIASFAAELVNGYGGAISSEHGDGRSRSWLNEKFFGQELYALYRQVKQIFDPHHLLNPGNIVDAPPMTAHLRYGPEYLVIPIKEHLDFSADQGFHRAVEMCNGAGVCRKKTGGTMCPSFMVTREEEHSTRGRANALRAALSGALPAAELTSPRMYEVLDLCIECKACKAECPSSVDMTKIKFEFLAHYYEQHPVPLRAKLFADIAFYSHLSSGLTAPLANSLLKNGLIRWGLEKFLGISRQRPLPEFASEPFTRWFKRRKGVGGWGLGVSSQKGGREENEEAKTRVVVSETRKTQDARPSSVNGQLSPVSGFRPALRLKGVSNGSPVVLFNDTFNTYNYPHVAIAATEVLEAAGFEVILPGHKCCGRPMMSKGLVKQARRAAQETIDRLAPLAEQGLPIVGLEPSCLLSLRDEYFSLLPGDPRVKLVADHCFTFEEFIARLADSGELNLNFSGVSRPVLLHGHCHQKALVGTGPSRRILALPGHSVTEIDSGCCGMAGAFGYETEHYDISLAMAERRLLPIIRQKDQNTIIAAAGVSCRQQIKHGTGRQAYHPAEILRAALK